MFHKASGASHKPILILTAATGKFPESRIPYFSRFARPSRDRGL